MMRSKLLITLMLLGAMTVEAQIPPSSSGMGLVQEASIPINLYTGVPIINAPLYTLSHHNGHVIPVNLGYNAGGHKVQDVAGPAGLGWRLQAGGMITRIVRGKPDNGTIASPNDHTQWINEIGVPGSTNPNFHGEQNDLEYDMFFFSFPGRSGKFLVQTNGTAYAMPHQDLKIEKTGTFDNAKWKITDEQGNIYYFNWDGNEYEKTISNTSKPDGTYDANDEVEFISTWHLTKIDYYNTPHDVLFSYVTRNTYDYEIYNNVASVSWNTCNSTINRGYSIANTKIEIENPKHLSSISTLQGSVSFSWSNSRLDIGSAYLEKIVVKDHSLVQVKEFDLQYSYSDAADARWYGDVPYKCDVLPSNEDRYRLSLDRILSDNFLYRKFHYKNGESYDPAIQNCSNQVDLYQLPPRDSYQQDHWGYSSYFEFGINGPNQPEARYTKTEKDQKILLDGHHRNPSLEGSLGNVLYRVDIPTGGHTLLEYELNKGLLYTYSAHLPEENIGGVRVKKVSHHDGNSLTNEVNYTYGLGVIREKPSHYYSFHRNPVNNQENITNDYYSFGSSCFGVTSYVSSNSFNSLFDLNGTHIEYGSVTVSKTGSGSVRTSFYTSRDQNGREDELPLIEKHGGLNYLTGDKYGPPFVPFTTNFWKRGSIKTREFFENGVTHPVKREHFLYNSFLTGTEFTSKRATRPPTAGGILSMTYYDRIGGNQLEKITTDITRATNSTHTLTSVRDIDYSIDYANYPKEVVETYADGSQRKTFISYVFDIAEGTEPTSPNPNAGALWKLMNDNVVSTPIETVSMFRESVIESFTVLGGHLTEYVVNSSLQASLPVRRYGFSSSNPIVESTFNYADLSLDGKTFNKDSKYELISSLSINGSGNITSATDEIGGQPTDYTYDSHGYITRVEYNPTGNNRYVDYTYKSLIGLESETDVNTKSVSYEYDNRNRLHLVKDDDLNIIERYRYNLAEEDNVNIMATIGISGSIKNQLINFTTENLTMYGGDAIADFKWNIDGVEKTGKSVSHTFTTAGAKTIKLNIINPEYDDPKVIEMTLTIYDAEWDAGAISGPTTICLDGTQQGLPYYTESDFFFPTMVTGGYTCYPGGANQFDWEYSFNQSSWTDFPNNTEPGLTFPFSLSQTASTLYMRLKITDNCGVTKTSPVKTITVTGVACSGGGGGGGACTISGSPASHTFDENGGSTSFTVTTSAGGFVVSEAMTWLSISNITSTSFTATCSPAIFPRSGTITLTGNGGSCTDTISISQTGDINN